MIDWYSFTVGAMASIAAEVITAVMVFLFLFLKYHKILEEEKKKKNA